MVCQSGIGVVGGGQWWCYCWVLFGFDNQLVVVVVVLDKVEDWCIVDVVVVWDGKQFGVYCFVKVQVFLIQMFQYLGMYVFQMQMVDMVVIFVQYVWDFDFGDKGVFGIKCQFDVVMGVRQKLFQFVIVFYQYYQMMVIGQLEVIVVQQQVSKGIQFVVICCQVDVV